MYDIIWLMAQEQDKVAVLLLFDLWLIVALAVWAEVLIVYQLTQELKRIFHA